MIIKPPHPHPNSQLEIPPRKFSRTKISHKNQVTVERWVPVASVAKVKMQGLSLIPAAGAPLKISHVRNQWGKTSLYFSQTYLNWWFDLKWRFLKQKYSSVPKLPNCCREIRMFQLALRTYFGIYISKWQGSVKHFQQKFKLARFFGPKDQNLEWKACSLLARCSDLVQQLSTWLGLVRVIAVRNHPTFVGP